MLVIVNQNKHIYIYINTLWKCVCFYPFLSIFIPLLVFKTRPSSSALKGDWLGKLHVRVSGTGGMSNDTSWHLGHGGNLPLWGFHSSVREAQIFFPSLSTKLFGRAEPQNQNHIAKKREIWKDRCRKTIFISVKRSFDFWMPRLCWHGSIVWLPAFMLTSKAVNNRDVFSTVAVDGSILGHLNSAPDGIFGRCARWLQWGLECGHAWTNLPLSALRTQVLIFLKFRVKCYNGAPLCTMVHWAENWWFDCWWLSGTVAVLDFD